MIHITITQEQLDDVSSPYTAEVAKLGLLQSMNEAILSGGTVIFEDFDNNPIRTLHTPEDLTNWKEENNEWLPEEDEEE